MPLTESQKRAQAKYRLKESTKKKRAAYIKDKFGNIGAMFPKEEKNLIHEIFAEHGVKPAEIIRGAAIALINGETVHLHHSSVSKYIKETEKNDSCT